MAVVLIGERNKAGKMFKKILKSNEHQIAASVGAERLESVRTGRQTKRHFCITVNDIYACIALLECNPFGFLIAGNGGNIPF